LKRRLNVVSLNGGGRVKSCWAIGYRVTIGLSQGEQEYGRDKWGKN